MDWSDLISYLDDEGQLVYEYRGHVMDPDSAGHLLDAANGHAAPTRWTDTVLGR